MRRLLKHPKAGRFRAEGAMEWPDDNFTRKRLRDGDIPIFEPDLDRLVAANMRERRLDFTTDLPGPVAEAEAVFIAVGTPSRRGDGHADLSHVFGASEEIGRALSGPAVVVTKSTVPVGSPSRWRAGTTSATSRTSDLPSPF
jgi:UDP-glucose 6-dehydrogenase